MSEAVTMPSLTMMTSTVSDESLVRNRHAVMVAGEVSHILPTFRRNTAVHLSVCLSVSPSVTLIWLPFGVKVDKILGTMRQAHTNSPSPGGMQCLG